MKKIKLGEIKAHSIMLLFPDLELSYDSGSEDSLKGVIENLKYDPNTKDILLACTPSINRAFTIIEKRGGSKTKSSAISVTGIKNGRLKIKLSDIAGDVYRVCKVYNKNGKAIPFESETDDEIYLETKDGGEYTFIYKSKIKRINEATSDFCEIDLSEGISEIIPYFVKSEVLFSEDRGASDTARILFDGILKELSSLPMAEAPEIKSVYYME